MSWRGEAYFKYILNNTIYYLWKADTWNSLLICLFLGALNWCLQKKAGTKIHSLKAVAWTWNCLVLKILKVIVKKFELQRVLKYDIFQCFSTVFCLVGWGGGLGRTDRSGATHRLLHSQSYSPQVVVSGWLIENQSRDTIGHNPTWVRTAQRSLMALQKSLWKYLNLNWITVSVLFGSIWQTWVKAKLWLWC